MDKYARLHVLADENGRILATAHDGAATEGAPALLGLRAGKDQQAYVVEVPAEQAADEHFVARLSTDFRVKVETPPGVRLTARRSG